MDPHYAQLKTEYDALRQDYQQLQASHGTLREEMTDFHEFYGTDKLRDLTTEMARLDASTRRTAAIQLAVTAVTPLITLGIALITFFATRTSDDEKNRIERLKLATDIYTKALTKDSTAVLLNAITLTQALLKQSPQDAEVSAAMTQGMLDMAYQRTTVKQLKVNPLVRVDSAARDKQKVAIAQLKSNAKLDKQANGKPADSLAQHARRTLRGAGHSADSLARVGYAAIRANNFADAQRQFALADLTYPTRYNYYEMNRYLNRYTAQPHANKTSPQLIPARQQAIRDSLLAHIPYRVRIAIQQLK